MELSFTDPDQWYEGYESASPEQQYEILMETLKQPLSQNSIEDSGLGDCLIDMLGILTSNNLIEQALDFITRFIDMELASDLTKPSGSSKRSSTKKKRTTGKSGAKRSRSRKKKKKKKRKR